MTFLCRKIKLKTQKQASKNLFANDKPFAEKKIQRQKIFPIVATFAARGRNI